MFYQVKHVTRYRFSHPVVCDPLTLRLRPRDDATQRLHRFRLNVWPAPAGLSEHVDSWGNAIAVAWLPELTLSLAVTTSLLVETLSPAPIHETLQERARQLPRRCQHHAPNSLVGKVAERLAAEVDHQTLPFLEALAAQLAERTDHLVTERSSEPQTPEATWTERRGDCRDLAALFNAACRAVHLQARMMSGYYPSSTHPHLLCWHSWSEVYLPGEGWRGFDPSLGVPATEKHVAVTSGLLAADTAPTQGIFGSSHARWHVETQIAATATSCDPRTCCPAA